MDEDIAIGTSILKVKAADADSGQNAEIEYYLSDDHFTVSSAGIISNNRRLDADSNNAYYEFVVTAKDKGNTVIMAILGTPDRGTCTQVSQIIGLLQEPGLTCMVPGVTEGRGSVFKAYSVGHPF